MKNALDWIKTNPFNVAASVVALVALVGFAYLFLIAAPNFTEVRSDEVKKLKDSQRRLTGISVPLPNEDPNEEPIIESLVINQKVIDDVSGIYNSIKGQYEGITLDTSERNAANHRGVMLAGEGLFPGEAGKDFALAEKAAADYRQHFKDVFRFGGANKWNLPSMRVGSPPTEAEIQALLDATAFDFISSIGVESAAALTPEQAQQLYAFQRMRLMAKLTERARSIHLYTVLPPDEDPFYVAEPGSEAPAAAPAPSNFDPLLGGSSGAGGSSGNANNGLPADYPFTIEAWAFADTAPDQDQLWEGQVQLWVLRDVMSAIHATNRVGQKIEITNPQGATELVDAVALYTPIKRLLRLEHVPGYIGLHTTGGVSASDASGGPSGNTFSAPSPGVSPAAVAGVTPSIYPAPPIELKPNEPTQSAREHFGITPTGRVSNSVFDVRHSRLVIDIEWDALPRLMEALRVRNFMTVIEVDIEDIDEYELLQQGYAYGEKDVVRAELLIESLWFRQWTAGLMPKVVREKLLIDLPANTATQFNEFEDF